MKDLIIKAEKARNYIKHWLNDSDLELPIKSITKEVKYINAESETTTETFIVVIPNKMVLAVNEEYFYLGSLWSNSNDIYPLDGNDTWNSLIIDLEVAFLREYKESWVSYIMETLPIEDHFRNRSDFKVHQFIKNYYKDNSDFKVRSYYDYYEKHVNISVTFLTDDDKRHTCLLCDAHIWYDTESGEFQFRFFTNQTGVPEIDDEKCCKSSRALEIAEGYCRIPCENAAYYRGLSEEQKQIMENLSSKKFREWFLKDF